MKVLRVVTTPALVIVGLVLLYLAVGKQTDPAAITALTDHPDAKSAHAYDPNVVRAMLQHLKLVGISAAAALVIAIPLGVLLTRTRSKVLSGGLTGFFSAGQAVPTIGVFVLLVAFFGLKGWIPYAGLIVFGVLPIMRNTIEGISNVDPGLVDAARGQGFSTGQVLTRVELPLAVPIILSGVRTALVLIVGTATIATFVNGKGLGDLIDAGITSQRDAVLLTGATLAALLAVTVDWAAGILERQLSPKGLRRGSA